MTKLNKLNCPYDMEHIGELFTRVREHRGVMKSRLAEKCNVSMATLTRLENEGTGIKTKQRREAYERFIQALQKDLARIPLKENQANILIDLFDYSQKDEVDERQRQLAELNFETIIPTNRSAELNELVEQLEQEDRPALIMDPLWFIHAVNGALFDLFGINSKSKYLNCWEAWHIVAAKFYPESPVRLAHHDLDLFFPPAIDLFFSNQVTLPYLFTIQMRWLLCKLHELSKQHNYNFTTWWEAVVSFSIDYEEDNLNRILHYKKDMVYLNAKWRPRHKVEIVPGYPVQYIPVVWEPIDPIAQQVFEDIQSLPESHKVYYAADYDANQDFHVNNWVEIKSEIENL